VPNKKQLHPTNKKIPDDDICEEKGNGKARMGQDVLL
jgi:hypothetical protein